MLLSAGSSLSYPAFVEVEGVINIRSVGGYKTSSGRTVKPIVLYRSGDISSITDKGKEQFTRLGIQKVYDFRADTEIRDYESSTPVIEGVEIVRVPAGIQDAFDPASIALRLKNFQTNELDTFLLTYEEIMQKATSSFKKIFMHLKDNPDQTCLVHCTAGKDRTGVFIALLMMILGVVDQQIVDEYVLTTIGLAPAFLQLAQKLQKVAAFRDNWDGVLNMGSSKPETMAATLNMIRDRYGGAEGYFRDQLGMSEEDIETIRSNFIVD